MKQMNTDMFVRQGKVRKCQLEIIELNLEYTIERKEWSKGKKMANSSSRKVTGDALLNRRWACQSVMQPATGRPMQ